MGHPIVLMMAFARSGGTLLNRCLAALPNTIVLSEVHPLGGAGGDTCAAQARTWYGIDVPTDGFVSEVRSIEKAATGLGRELVLREWSYANYLPTPYDNEPPGSPLCLELLTDELTVVPFALVRDAIDVWLSADRDTRDMRAFARAYRQFVEDLLARDLPLVRFEDLTADPEGFLADLCWETGLTYSADFADFHEVDSVRGDISGSRGLHRRFIAPLSRKPARASEIREIEGNADVRSVNEQLGYPLDYHARPVSGPREELGDRIRALRYRASQRIGRLLS